MTNDELEILAEAVMILLRVNRISESLTLSELMATEIRRRSDEALRS